MLVFRAQFHKCNCWYLELNFTNVTVAIGAWSVVPFVVWALEEDDTVWRTDPIGVTRAPVCPGETLRMSLPHKLSVPWCISPAYPIVTWCVFYQYNVTRIYHYYLLYFFFIWIRTQLIHIQRRKISLTGYYTPFWGKQWFLSELKVILTLILPSDLQTNWVLYV